MPSWVDDNGVLTRGKKHKGHSVESVAEHDPDYLRWLLDEVELEFLDREVIRAMLARFGELNP